MGYYLQVIFGSTYGNFSKITIVLIVESHTKEIHKRGKGKTRKSFKVVIYVTLHLDILYFLQKKKNVNTLPCNNIYLYSCGICGQIAKNYIDKKMGIGALEMGKNRGYKQETVFLLILHNRVTNELNHHFTYQDTYVSNI